MEVQISYEYISLPRQATNLKGQRFGRLLVVGPIEVRRSYVYWHAKCECGKDVEIRSSHLLDGSTQSCGCWRKERGASQSTVHGLYRSRIYKIWAGIKSRCNNPNDLGYRNYGGRGVTICQKWNDSFVAFNADVAMLAGYNDPSLSLDRINNDGNYEPSNVRWATNAQQRRNSRQNHMLTHKGKTQCLVDWAIECGLTHTLLSQRLKMGWELERALITPIGKYTRREIKP